MRLRSVCCSALVLFLFTRPAVAFAQQEEDETLRDVLTFLVTHRTAELGGFVRDPQSATVTSETLANAVLHAVATVPLGSSSGGFTYTFNSQLGVPERESQTFGPSLLERPLTARVGVGSWGISYRFARFGSLDGADLRDGSFVTAAHRLTGAREAFDEETLTLQIDMRTAAVFVNYGLADRVEIGAALPLVTLQVEGRRMNRQPGASVLQAAATATDTGLGDMALRIKHHFVGRGDTGLAADLDVRLPTGSEENFRGAGTTSVKLGITGALDVGSSTLYGNAAHMAGGLAAETRFGGGVAAAAGPRASVSAELLVRRFHDLPRSVVVAVPHPSMRGVETTRVAADGEPMQSVQASTGFKWNVGGNWLLSGHVLWTLNDAGVRAWAMPTIALDYAF